MDAPAISALVDRLARIESALALLVEQKTVKDWYSTAEIAQLLGLSDYTVREHCRLRRIEAVKRRSGRGAHGEWMVSHAELTRVRNEGLLPFRPS